MVSCWVVALGGSPEGRCEVESSPLTAEKPSGVRIRRLLCFFELEICCRFRRFRPPIEGKGRQNSSKPKIVFATSESRLQSYQSLALLRGSAHCALMFVAPCSGVFKDQATFISERFRISGSGLSGNLKHGTCSCCATAQEPSFLLVFKVVLLPCWDRVTFILHPCIPLDQ